MLVLGLAIIGIGGLVNAIYIIIEMRVPPEHLGASIVIIMTITIFCSGCAPNLAFLPAPIPLYIQLTLLFITFVCLVKLPDGGQYLPRVPKEVSRQDISDISVTSMQMIVSIEKSLNSSVFNPVNGPAPTFKITHQELKLGVLRPRLVQSRIDLDLVQDMRLMGDE